MLFAYPMNLFDILSRKIAVNIMIPKSLCVYSFHDFCNAIDKTLDNDNDILKWTKNSLGFSHPLAYST